MNLLIALVGKRVQSPLRIIGRKLSTRKRRSNFPICSGNGPMWEKRPRLFLLLYKLPVDANGLLAIVRA